MDISRIVKVNFDRDDIISALCDFATIKGVDTLHPSVIGTDVNIPEELTLTFTIK